MASAMALERIYLPKPALYTEGNGTKAKDMARGQCTTIKRQPHGTRGIGKTTKEKAGVCAAIRQETHMKASGRTASDMEKEQ